MATKILSMGHFTAIGMRTKVEDESALTISTCGSNDTSARGTYISWAWSNPTNRAMTHLYEDVEAVSVEALWQGTKVFEEGGRPDPGALAGNWRRGKARRPVGAWAGPDKPLITTPGEARRRIYIPAFRVLIEFWMKDREVCRWIERARAHRGPVYLRDHDTGRGIDRDGPLSHAWILCMFLNTGGWDWVYETA